MFHSILLSTDSYKVSQWRQYPQGTAKVYSYLEARKNSQETPFNETVFFGLNYILQKHLSRPISQNDIDEADGFFAKHFGNKDIFNKNGWDYILKEHNGRLPISIKAVPEGSVVSLKNALMTIENTDKKCYWLTNYLETILLQAWYSTTVCSLSREIKKVIYKNLVETGTPESIDFKFVDFGYRGSTSNESAGIGGAAHLVNFKATDNLSAIVILNNHYDGDMAGYSIPASEHSTITSWGREREVDTYRNMIKQYGDNPLYACVSDSYDIHNACEKLWGETLKNEVLNAKGTLVIRPDSGCPHEMVLSILTLLGKKFGCTENNKGYKVLNPKVRVIQGDGIDYKEIKNIIANMKINGWSGDNLAYGCGGALLQKVNRDSFGMAIKCSYAEFADGSSIDVYKDPITDPGKVSKRGRLALHKEPDGSYATLPEGVCVTNELKEVYRNGEILIKPTLAEIRERAKI